MTKYSKPLKIKKNSSDFICIKASVWIAKRPPLGQILLRLRKIYKTFSLKILPFKEHFLHFKSRKILFIKTNKKNNTSLKKQTKNPQDIQMTYMIVLFNKGFIYKHFLIGIQPLALLYI